VEKCLKVDGVTHSGVDVKLVTAKIIKFAQASINQTESTLVGMPYQVVVIMKMVVEKCQKVNGVTHSGVDVEVGSAKITKYALIIMGQTESFLFMMPNQVVVIWQE
jgi:hypothetical protein